MKFKVIWPDGASVRTLPSIFGSKVFGVVTNTIIDAVEENIPDRDEPTNEGKKWIKDLDNHYVASIYNNQRRLEKIIETPTPSPVPDLNVDVHLQVRGGVVTSVVVDDVPWSKQT